MSVRYSQNFKDLLIKFQKLQIEKILIHSKDIRTIMSVWKREEVYLKVYQTLTEAHELLGKIVKYIVDCKIKPNT